MINLNKVKAELDKFLPNYVKLLSSIKNEIWLHTNKKKFLRKTSIINYLTKLSNIKTNNGEIILMKQKYSKLLEEIRKEIEGYENTTANTQGNMSINLNVTQDITRLKGLKRIDDYDEALNQLMNSCSIEKNDSLTNISQILLTNDNFTYEDLPAIPKHDSNNNNNSTVNFVNNSNTSMIPGTVLQTPSSNEIYFQAETVCDTIVSPFAVPFANPDLSYSNSTMLQKHSVESGFNKLNKSPKPLLVHGNNREILNTNIFNAFQKTSPLQTPSSNEIYFQAETVSDTIVSPFANPDLYSNSTTLQKHSAESGFNKLTKGPKPLLVHGNNRETLKSNIFNEFQKPSDASIVSPLTNISSVITSRWNDIPNVSTEILVDSGFSSSCTSTLCDDYNLNSKKRKISCIEENSEVINEEECVSEVTENPFINPEVAKRCLAELNELINNFKKCALRNIDQIVAEDKKRNEKVEKTRKPARINPFFFNKNNPIPPLPVQSQESKVTTPPTTDADLLATLYTKMYKELFDNTESDIEMLD